jgi:hypothetical protein
MDYFTTRNTVILALVQVGVIVLGVLGAGAAHKWSTTFNIRLPSSTIFVAEYGFLALVLPVAWVTVALLSMRRDAESENAKPLVFYSGILLLLVLLLTVGCAGVRPLAWLLGVSG